MRYLSSVVLLSAASTWLACSPFDSMPPRTVRVLVADDEGHALSGIAVELDGMSATRTAADGTARISLSAHGPARARIGVSCDHEHRAAAPRHVPRASAGGTAKLDLSFVCRPRLRKLAVVVRAPGAQGLWLRADGEPVGRIESDGTLHATVMRAPDSELRLTIDTAELPLTPRHPTRAVHVPDHDELIVFDQEVLALRGPARRASSKTGTAPPRDEWASGERRSCSSCVERSGECTAAHDSP
ncbi:MAG: hypothetical protein JWN04_2389 [Myxococcaceae bacterium]|nr:hypothetical protein [Myxococcaceae bacterium]